MAENIKIPKFLQERDGPTVREVARQEALKMRKRASHKMGVLATKPFYYKDVTRKVAKQEKLKEKGKPYISIEPTPFEEYHQERVLKLRKIGSAVMTTPGLSEIGDAINDRKLSKSRTKQRRQAYIQRNGTVKSNWRGRYIDHKTRFPDDPEPTSK